MSTIFNSQEVTCRVCGDTIVLNGVPDLENHMQNHSASEKEHHLIKDVDGCNCDEHSSGKDKGKKQPAYAETFKIFAEHFLKEKLVRKSRTMKAELRDNLLIEGEDIDYVRKKKDGSVGFYKGRELVHEVAAEDIDIDEERCDES